MNFTLNNLPKRTEKPRDLGLTMIMDKGLGLTAIEDFLNIAGGYVDIVKLGFGTSYVTPILKEKLELYRKNDIPVYFGGTLFEAFIARGQFEDYIKLIERYEMEYLEVSDGSLEMDHKEKCRYIKELSKVSTVLSEVGSKDEEKIIPPYKWIELMKAELEAGAYKVIAEARESGNVGIYRGTGEVRSGLVQEILTQIPQNNIIWEAPKKAQQVWFIKLLGTNVNLGNIAPQELIPLETLRLGLRADTLKFFLNGENSVV